MAVGRVAMAAVVAVFAVSCAGDEGGEGEEPGVSAQVRELTVGGHRCPTRGEIAGRTIPDDDRYYLTTFGGSRDTQRMACGGVADGTSLYIADSWRFGCNARVRVRHPTNGRWCVARVADVGPNICVEQAARRAIIDASPRISRHLYGVSSAGWSDRITVIAEEVAASTPLGCGTR